MQQYTVSPAQCPLAATPCQAILRPSGRAQLLRRHILKAANPGRVLQRKCCSAFHQHLILGTGLSSSKCRSCKAAARAGTACSVFASESTVATRSTSEWAQVPRQYQNKTYLQELRAQDFALVRDGAVQFRPGLNAISGESGAGKSVLLGALMQLLGAPADADCVRHGADLASVEGRWWLNSHMAEQVRHEMRKLMLPSKAMPAPEGGEGDAGGGGYVHIKRELVKSDDGTIRSRVLINGCPSSLRVLRVIGTLLVDVNAQHASLALREGQQQLQLLDRIAGSSHLVQRLSLRVSRLAELEALLSKADALSDEAERQTLEEDVERIDNAKIEPDEEVTLRRRLSALQSRKTNLETAAIVQASLQGEYSEGGQSYLEVARLLKTQVRSVLSAEQDQHRLLLAEKQQHKQAAEDSSSSTAAAAAAEDDESDLEVQAVAAAISNLEAAVQELEDIVESVQAASSQLLQYASVAGYSASESTTITKRLDQLTRLCRRFGVRTTSELLELADEWSEQLDAYYENLDKQEVWRAEASALQQDITNLALQLSSSRVAAAAALSAAVEGCFDQLAMSSSRFMVDIRWRRSNRVQPCSRAVWMPADAEPAAAQQHTRSDTRSTSSSNGGGSDTSWDNHSTTGSSSSSNSYLYDLSSSGLDHVEFLLSAGPAEPLRSLATVASGGEAARVMLALKAAPAAAAAAAAASNGWQSGFAAGERNEHLQGDAEPSDLVQRQAMQRAVEDVSQRGSIQQGAAHQATIQQQQQQQQEASAGPGSFSIGPPVVVMDETDAGVGARLGNTVGRLLRDMTGGTHPAAQQLIVVSHTPQVAAHAAHHIKVSKATSDADGRVITTFTALESPKDRQVELADMMGRPGDSQALGFAADMLAAATGMIETEALFC